MLSITYRKNKMASRWPSWILGVKVCYRYFSESSEGIFLKFDVKVPPGP